MLKSPPDCRGPPMSRPKSSVPASRRPRRIRPRPMVEGLEARALMAAGGLDPSFGTAGYFASPTRPGSFTGLNAIDAVAVEKDGSVVAGGIAGKSGSNTFGVIHLTASGRL